MESGTALYRSTYSPTKTYQRVSALALTTCVGLLVGIASAGETTTSPRSAISVTDIANPNAQVSKAIVKSTLGARESIISSSLIVRSDDQASLEQLIVSLVKQVPGIELSEPIDSDGQVFVVKTPSVSAAVRVHKLIQESSSVQSVMLDQAPTQSDQSTELLNLRRELRDRGLRPQVPQGTGINAGLGITPLPMNQDSRGGSGDPLFSSQWHFVNTTGFVGNDNNIPSSIYDTMGLSGAGVNVAVSSLALNRHIDVDHIDLATNYNSDLSQIFDPTLLPDNREMTAYAGIISAERDNGVAGQGIAPGSTISTINWITTPLIEFQAYDWMNQDLDIKTFQTSVEYDFPGAGYNNGNPIDYVMDGLSNSIRFGRSGRGVVNVFGTGVGFNLLPDPYSFPPAMGDSFSPIDELQASGNEVSDGVTNAFSSGLYYIGGQISHYPPAVDRRSLVINTVSEDGHYDSLSGMGTAVFASVFGGSSNEFWSGSQAVSGRGITTTIPGGGASGLVPEDANDIFNANMSGTSVAGGIIALMLETNPRLTIRDIQHIFFESIQESTRPASVKWPQFDTTRSYYVPNDPLAGRYNFWGINSGFYNSDMIANQSIRHSDQYGFGVIDTELALSKASTWGGTPRLFLLDSGIVGDVNDGTTNGEDFRVPLEIPDATFVENAPADGSTGTNGASTLVPGGTVVFNFCIRENISIEALIVELTIEGNGSNDLFIELISPTGTRSILSMPTTRNFVGTAQADNPTDDEMDQGFTSGQSNGTNYAFYQHSLLTWKHWGELAGGVWTMRFTDHGPDEATPEGEAPGTGPMPDPGADMVTGLGEIGVPGSVYRSEKTVEAFRVKVYGSETGIPIFEGCNPFTTSCPGDLNGDGIINVADLQIFVNWWTTGNALADIDGDGDIDFQDLLTYRSIWIPGFCDASGDPFVGGRPRPGGSSNGDNDPVIRPI